MISDEDGSKFGDDHVTWAGRPLGLTVDSPIPWASTFDLVFEFFGKLSFIKGVKGLADCPANLGDVHRIRTWVG